MPVVDGTEYIGRLLRTRAARVARTAQALCILATVALAGCAVNKGAIRTYQPSAGSNEVLQGPIAAAPGHSLVVGDLVLAPGSLIARHTHAGEEFLYVLGGSVTISRQGESDVTLSAGQGLRIAPNTIHWGKVGRAGARAVASWVKTDGQPLRTPVP